VGSIPAGDVYLAKQNTSGKKSERNQNGPSDSTPVRAASVNSLKGQFHVTKKKAPANGTYIDVILDMERGQSRIARVESGYRFAFELKNAARVMANKARAVDGEDSFELRAFVTGAVILAWSSLDAALNEFILLNAVEPKSPLSETEKATIKAIGSEDLRPRGRSSTLELFNLILRLLKKPPLMENEQPYRSAEAVRLLRNELVHPIPYSIVTFSENPNENLSEQPKIVRQLRQDLNLDRNAIFPRDVLNSKCADWAVRSCESFLREFVERSEVSPGFVTKDVF
jgi:hypothetical protein